MKPAVVILAVLLAVVAGCSSTSGDSDRESAATISLANLDQANTRFAPSSISAATVSGLEQAWSVPVEARGEGRGFIGSPVVADGVVYLQDPDSNVRAIDLSSGRVLWEMRYEAPADGPNGVIVADGLVFGATPRAAFALNAETGQEVWLEKLVRNDGEMIAMTPGYHDGLVYISTVPTELRGNAIGVLWALDAESGEKVWHFDTAPRDLWGHPEINYGGGLSNPPAFDDEGSMYIGTGNPGPIPGNKRFPWGSSRPGPNLYTNSIVKLDAKTGKVDWSYQVTPHALCNWDVGGPVLGELRGRKVVIAAGLSGVVVSLDRETGDLLWRQPVGLHTGHDNDGLIAMRGEYEKLEIPMVVYPGVTGGAAGPIALRGSTVYVPVIDHATQLIGQELAASAVQSWGQLVALDVASGKVRWKQNFDSPLYGPVTLTGDLVFATEFDGTLYAFDASSGKRVWKEKLPSAAEGGLTIAGDTAVARAGDPAGEEVPRLLAYRLAG